MVEFVDGAMKAQLGVPDMRLPIAYALGERRREDYSLPRLTLQQLSELTFSEPDPERFPCLSLAYRALEQKGNTACVINAANEVAVAALLHGRIKYADIYRVIVSTLERAQRVESPAYEDYVQSNAEARAIASEIIDSIN